MSKLYQRYIAFVFLKNFFIVFLSLEFFYVGVDLLSNLKNLPNSANLQLLYVYYNAQVAINYTLPLGIVFAMIISKINMIKSNELISLYASTVSKSKAIFPIFLPSIAITCILVGLNFTSFPYANSFKKNLVKYNTIQTSTNNIFVKYNNKYVYIKKLNPLSKEAFDIKIFNTDNNTLTAITSIQKAYFKNNAWHSKTATIKYIPKVKNLGDEGVKEKETKNTIFLKGFKPKTMNTIHKEKASLNIIDALDALKFLSKQNANINQIKSVLYSLIFSPFFAPFMAVILFFYLPVSGRFFNLALLSFGFVFITISVWGVLFLLNRFAINGVLNPEFAIIAPIFLMGIGAISLYRKNK